MEKLLINVDQIEGAREPWDRTLSKAWLAEQVFADLKGWEVRSPVEFHGLLTKMAGDALLFEGDARVEVRSSCRRCLRDVDTSLPLKFTLNVVPRRRADGTTGEGEDDGEGERGGTFDDALADEEYYEGENVDAGSILREQILLAIPAIEPLCREACAGLCTTCGQDLNEKDCGHAQKAPDPRWSALKDLKLS